MRVVIDEAHHAVSKTYGQLIEAIREQAPRSIMVGLTATPWPRGAGLTAKLKQLFPVVIAYVQVRELVRSGVLARPIYYTVDTGQWAKMSAADRTAMTGLDIPAAVLRRLDRPARNSVIVTTWLDRQQEWGKTLLFACDIEHADHLGELLTASRVNATVVHSRADIERSGAIERFRREPGPSVLVSVGMLLEGVDVPDARTAFLARPTTSRILMRQMVGRVLRGETGGGEAFAHVVDLRDRWGADVDVLAPVDVPLLVGSVADRDLDDEREHVLPPVRDELTETAIGEDVLLRIEKVFAELRVTHPLPHAAALVETALVGFYELGDVNVPVFDHTKESWAELIAAELSRERQGFGLRSTSSTTYRPRGR